MNRLGARAPRRRVDGRASLLALVGRGHVGVDDGGRGGGTAENARAESGTAGTSELDLRLGIFEVRRRLADWFGLRAVGGPVRSNAQGRILVLHSAADTRSAAPVSR